MPSLLFTEILNTSTVAADFCFASVLRTHVPLLGNDKNDKNTVANPRKGLGAHMRMGMVMRALHRGAAETRGALWVCSDGGFSCDLQDDLSLEKEK